MTGRAAAEPRSKPIDGARARVRVPDRATAGALAPRTGNRNSARMPNTGAPPWRAWRTRSRAARCIRWIETYCRVPEGPRAGEPMVLHKFQRDTLDALLANDVRTGGLQIPRGNAKSTLCAAVGLWAVCDEPDAPQVPLVAVNGMQAERTLFKRVRRMIRLNDELASRCAVYTNTSGRRVWSAWNDGELLPLPADADRLQGLNPTVALIDEAQAVSPEVWQAVAQGAGKRAASLVLAIGTPAPNGQGSALWALRERAREGARIAWVEYAAPEGCAVDDRRAWHIANPGLRAGLLYPDVLDGELSTVPEAEFRLYRLGQWIDAAAVSWLPLGAWEDCPHADIPDDDDEIVIALAGTWHSSVALVGCTLDGAVFLAWASDSATDDELEQALADAHERWRVVEIVFAPRVRSALARRLTDDGSANVTIWPARADLEVASATDWRRAIVDGRVAHDHDALLSAHVAAQVGTVTADGGLRLVSPDDGADVDAARAARMAWWRAVEHAESVAPAIY